MMSSIALLVFAVLVSELANRNGAYGFTLCCKTRLFHRPSTTSVGTDVDEVVVRPTKLFSKQSRFRLLSSSHVDESEPSTGSPDQTIRSRLRQVTGFSLTAFRAAMRTATGISMTAIYASTLAFSGQWMRQTMKFVLSIFPAWSRYFVQPFLILYYLPLFTLRNLTGPNRRRGMNKPQALVDGWNEAVMTADDETSAFFQDVDEDL